MLARTVRTMCPMNCHPAFCRMLVEVSEKGRPDVLLTAGTDMLNSFSGAGAVERDLQRVGLIVAYDIFSNDTIRRVADIVLPGVLWARDGWPGLNTLTSGEACLRPEARDGLDPRIPGGQSAYDARVEVRPIPA